MQLRSAELNFLAVALLVHHLYGPVAALALRSSHQLQDGARTLFLYYVVKILF